MTSRESGDHIMLSELAEPATVISVIQLRIARPMTLSTEDGNAASSRYVLMRTLFQISRSAGSAEPK